MENKMLQCFSKLTFNEEKHIYYVNNIKIKISVSGLIKNFVREVDFDEKARNIDRREGLAAGTTKAKWSKKAELACEKGTKVHLFGELYPFNKTLKPENKFEEAVVKFWNDVPEHIVPVTMELQMYHYDYMFAGTADIILYNTKTDTYIIGDYKTNENLFKNFRGKKLTGVFRNLLDNSFNKYQIQLSFYQILFEQMNLKVSSRKLVWLLPTGEYEMYDTIDYTAELKEHLKHNGI